MRIDLPQPIHVFNDDTLPIVRLHNEGDTVKFCQMTHDELEIESVVIAMGGKGVFWNTLCVSSQIGCARGCTFCQTARMGLIRNLTVGEIVGQVAAANAAFEAQVRNVVFMGMGEPLDNYDNVVESIERLHREKHFDIARRRIAVSTVGHCEGIRKLAALNYRRLGLAISLNAPNDEIRNQIMPINRRSPMAELRDAIASYPVRSGGHLLIEYVLLAGLNDALEHARELAAYLKGLRTCVNLIPWNPCEGLDHQTPTEERVTAFQDELIGLGQMTFRRRTKGRGAMGACGQLGNLALKRLRQNQSVSTS